MSMNNVGRPTRPEAANEETGFASLSGGRGLLQDEPLIFELGGWDKTGVDLPEGKNYVGAVYQPEALNQPA